MNPMILFSVYSGYATIEMIFCGSKQQISRLIGKNSCISAALRLENSGLVGFKTLTANHRNPVLTEITLFDST